MIREKLRNIVYAKDSPRKVAMSFAVGTFIGVSPFLGFHTVLILAVAWMFRLNKVVALTAAYITNPLTLIPIYTFCIWIGAVLLGVDITAVKIDWDDFTMSVLFSELKLIVAPFFLGTTVLGGVGALASYFPVKAAVIKAHAMDEQNGLPVPGKEIED